MCRFIGKALAPRHPALLRLAPALLTLSVTAANAIDVSYTYDALGRVTTVTIGEGSALDYTLDPAGNRTLVQVGKAAPGPDSDGNGVGDACDGWQGEPCLLCLPSWSGWRAILLDGSGTEE